MDLTGPSATRFATRLISMATEILPASMIEVVSQAPVPFGLAVVVLVTLIFSHLIRKKGRDAPAIPERIPFVSNSLLYSRDLPFFCQSVGHYLSENKLGIATFRLFFQKMHLVVGAANTNPLFQQRSSGLSDHPFMLLFLRAVADPPPQDFDQWRIDNSGRLKTPNPGTEHITGHMRLHTQWHSIMSNYLARPSMSLDLAEMYYSRLLERYRADFVEKSGSTLEGPEWKEMRVLDWMRQNMTPAAGVSFGGSLFLEMFPGYFDVMREFELSILKLCFGPPKWLNGKPYEVQERWLSMNQKVITSALKRMEGDFEAVEKKWTPELGHPVMRETIRWLRDVRKVSLRTMGGFFGMMVMDQNGNTVPAVAWAIMQILTSPVRDSLIKRLRQEAEQTRKSQHGDGRFDIQKLTNMPLYSAVFTETLRLHCSFNITRMATKDMVMEGYDVKKGSLVQAPTLIAHFNPVWESPEYPVHEFWPDRLLKVMQTTTTMGVEEEEEGEEKGEEEGEGAKKKTTKTEFDMTINNRSSYWFPFGGGLSMCPGRLFAKQEVTLALALFFTMFDTEVVGWEMSDGTESDRPAKDSEGFITMLPDREMRLRVRSRAQ